ncbi:magnesium transporter CorA family protein [Pseudomonas matsuisoli]|uniref:Magnesium transport protein CorA n=1 Tax=Pseudomonas matsuisoli TaxID=1515666 RepID=A0A917V059_9PSED|nr:magnesium transporter CorA family protein [Pseudomonas matsuisoli]GGK03669.1 magnesium/cobalt transporter [Pseudomonas matsuisoli]
MITYYALHDGLLESHEAESLSVIPDGVLWIDLLRPSVEEERFVESALGVNIPTREEMGEIEDSSRFYEDNGTLYLTPTVISGISSGKPASEEVFFVIGQDRLVTVRYAEMTAMRGLLAKAARQPERHRTADAIFASLVDAFVDRIADTLEDMQNQLTRLSARIFNEPGGEEEKADLQRVIKHLGRHNALLSMFSESMLTFGRLISFTRLGKKSWLAEPARAGIKAVERDLRVLTGYQARMSNEISFLLDVTLGLINIEQNSIIKVFSIAAVIFLPPTLVGTVYGMNFKDMPELDWVYGYPLALGLMVLSAALSMALFRFKGWL